MNPEYLRAMLNSSFSGETENRDPEAVIMDLKEVYDAFRIAMTTGCKFAPGDIVTPKGGFATKGAGRPHIVLAVLPLPDVKPMFVGDSPSSNTFGRCIDMRVSSFYGDERASHWAESFEYELYAEAQSRKVAVS